MHNFFLVSGGLLWSAEGTNRDGEVICFLAVIERAILLDRLMHLHFLGRISHELMCKLLMSRTYMMDEGRTDMALKICPKQMESMQFLHLHLTAASLKSPFIM
jgi:hypothetical protein